MTGTLSGIVHVSGEPAIADLILLLRDPYTLLGSTQSDVNGDYAFTGLEVIEHGYMIVAVPSSALGYWAEFDSYDTWDAFDTWDGPYTSTGIEVNAQILDKLTPG